MILLEDKYIKITLVEKPVKFIYAVYTGFIPSEKFQKYLDFLEQTHIAHNINLQLNDTTNQKLIGEEDRVYANQNKINIIEQLKKPFYTAMIQSADLFARLAVEEFMNLTNDNANEEIVKTFTTEAQAIDWLVSKAD